MMMMKAQKKQYIFNEYEGTAFSYMSPDKRIRAEECFLKQEQRTDSYYPNYLTFKSFHSKYQNDL